jgi:hypothetical protein
LWRWDDLENEENVASPSPENPSSIKKGRLRESGRKNTDVGKRKIKLWVIIALQIIGCEWDLIPLKPINSGPPNLKL